MDKKKTEKTNGAAELFFWAQALTVALVVLVCCNTFFFRLSGVWGQSMENTLHANDQLILQIIGYDQPERGDVLVCTSDAFDGEALVKRVIAVEGDTVDISKDGYMMVNGEELYEPYAKEAIRDNERGTQSYPLTVLEDHLFVVGDNRNHSTDSRFLEVGQIEEARVIGKVLFRIWPLNKIGGIS
ncbi:MAG: signal peptidase I [Clostridia bacterium]|nr:signal peptidase I [Clostridia bacterium]